MKGRGCINHGSTLSEDPVELQALSLWTRPSDAPCLDDTWLTAIHTHTHGFYGVLEGFIRVYRVQGLRV